MGTLSIQVFVAMAPEALLVSEWDLIAAVARELGLSYEAVRKWTLE